ncbi:MAG: VanZ family protein [Abditibacteriales bacterium]|nr:VanZ family protein [Abditibacteriales bacterium]MDW8366073.1 VanZ family protein [Abditibacteriales bacterium]
MLYWLLTLAYMGVIFYLSSSPHPPTLSFPLRDKLGHALAYLVLGALLCRTLWETARGQWQTFVASVVIGVGYGGLMEWYQSRLAYRSCEWGDMVANALGVMMGVTLCQRWLKNYHRQPRLKSKV